MRTLFAGPCPFKQKICWSFILRSPFCNIIHKMLMAQTYLSVLSAFNYANLNYKNVNIKFQQNIKRTTCSWTPDTKPIVGNLMQNGKKGKTGHHFCTSTGGWQKSRPEIFWYCKNNNNDELDLKTGDGAFFIIILTGKRYIKTVSSPVARVLLRRGQKAQ